MHSPAVAQSGGLHGRFITDWEPYLVTRGLATIERVNAIERPDALGAEEQIACEMKQLGGDHVRCDSTTRCR